MKIYFQAYEIHYECQNQPTIPHSFNIQMNQRENNM